LLKAAGLDFARVDMEHSPPSIATEHLAAAAARIERVSGGNVTILSRFRHVAGKERVEK